MNKSERNSHLLFAALLALLLALPIFGLLAKPARGEPVTGSTLNTQNAWKAGLIDGAFLFNEHLNHYHIHTKVNGNSAQITGVVSNPIERALAEQIALSVDGIDHVKNELEINTTSAKESAPAGEPFFTDAAVTTKVKSQLLANTETNGLNIEVKASGNIVTLTGEVPSGVEKELAYYITRNTGGVRRVINKIEVEPKA